jgi:hypothetical protein
VVVSELQVPDSLKETLDEDVLAALDEALGPPADNRASGDFEVEIEAAGEGTFTIRYADGELSAKKGFARGDPLVSAAIPKGGWGLIQRCVQAAVDGWPGAPKLASQDEALKKLPAGDWEKMIAATERLKELGITLDIKGAGVFQLARGALDEVTRELHVSVARSIVEDVVAGGNPEALGAVQVSKGRGLLTELTAAYGPVLTILRR